MSNRVTQHMLSIRSALAILDSIELSNSVDPCESFSIRRHSAQHSLFPYVLWELVAHSDARFHSRNAIVPARAGCVAGEINLNI